MKASFATFNVARLGIPKKEKAAPDTPEAKALRDEIGQSFSEVDSDVLGLQEVVSQESLDTFLTEQNLGEKYPHRAFFKTNDGGSNHLAVLSKFPITATESHRKKTFQTSDGKERRLTRDVAEADIQVGSMPTKFYLVHLKADPYFANDPTPEEMKAAEERRLGEQGLVRQAIIEDLKAIPTQAYVVMGDINDDVDSSTAQAFLSDGTAPLIDPHAHLSGEEHLSHPPSNRRLDVTYLSPQLADKVVPGSAQVMPFHEGGSDHRPVKVTVDL